MERFIFELAGIAIIIFLLVYGIVHRKAVIKTTFALILSKIKLFLVGILILLCTFASKFAYEAIETKLTNIYDNGNGTQTIVKYKINGDSLITTNARIPCQTYGTVLSVEKKLNCVLNIADRGGFYTTCYIVKSKLDDGRIIEDKIDKNKSNISAGTKMLLSENFYPDYSKKFKYLKDN